MLGSNQFPATLQGYKLLTAWVQGFGTIERIGVQGTGAYGAGLARHLTLQSIAVVEIPRP
jgi:transposase